jgi:PAS domain S-box-containing protein
MPGKLDLTERLARIVATQEAIASIRLDPDAVMGVVVRQVMDLTEADGAVLEMVRQDEIHYHTAAGSLEPHTGTVFDIEGSLSGECVRTRKVLISDDTTIDPRVNTEISSITGSRSMVVVPLVNQDEVLGVIKVVAKRPRSFDDLDTYTLQLMAGFVAASLAQAERYKAELASEQRFRLLFEKNVAAAFFTTPEGEVEAVNDALIRMLGFESREEALGDQVWSRYEKESDRKELLDLLRTRKSLERHPVRLRRRDGTVINVVMNIEMVRGVGKTYLIGTMLETAGDTATSPKEPS